MEIVGKKDTDEDTSIDSTLAESSTGNTHKPTGTRESCRFFIVNTNGNFTETSSIGCQKIRDTTVAK